MAEQTQRITKDELHAKAASLVQAGYRLVQICCVKEPSGREPAQVLEMNYSFDKDYSFLNFKLDLSVGEELPSITPVCPAAYLYENEIHDLFGIKITGISVDFKGTLYKIAIPAPFNPAGGSPKER